VPPLEEEDGEHSSGSIRETLRQADEKVTEVRGLLDKADKQIDRWEREKQLRSGGTYDNEP
jgi:hypothetical protein